MNIFHKIIFLLVITISTVTTGQNVGINTTGTAPNGSAIIDLNTGNTFTPSGGGNAKGMLIPNVPLSSTTDATTVTTPATSLLVYNTASAGTYPTSVSPGYYYNSGTPASPIWTTFATVTGAVSFPYENRFYPAGHGGSGYYVMNSSNYGPGTFGDNTDPYSNWVQTYNTTTPASVPAYFGVWYVSWTASSTTQFVGYTGWSMVENQSNGVVGSSVLPGACTIGLYFYKYTPTAGNAVNIVGTLIASGTVSVSTTFVPQSIVFSPVSPVTLNKGDIIIGYATTSNNPYVGGTYSIVDIMGSIQLQ